MHSTLPNLGRSTWLEKVDPDTIDHVPFPLQDILDDSLYYPASGFDGDPVRYFSGNVFSFIYADYSVTRKDLSDALANPGFRGYEIIATRDVRSEELVPHRWSPLLPKLVDPVDRRRAVGIQKPFCVWVVLQRLASFSAEHGPRRISLLFLCGEGVASYQALYAANRSRPAVLAIIQPGHGFGNNWTNFENPNEALAEVVLGNPAGHPKFLLFGGIGKRKFYENVCWPEYSSFVGYLRKGGKGTIGIWKAESPAGN